MRRSPHRRRSRQSSTLALAAAIVAFAVGGVGILLFLGWPPFLSSTSPEKAGTATVVVAPGESARLASPAGDVLLEFPAGSVDRQTTVSYRRVSPTTVTAPPPNFTLTGKVFDLSVADTKVREDPEFRFLQPVTVTVFLTDDHTTPSDGSYSNVAIQRFDTDSGEWIPLQTTIDLAARTAQVKIRSLDSLALTVRGPVSLPERVLTHGPMLPQGYLGRGVVSLTIPRELGETNTARVSLKITLGDPYPADRSTPGPTEGRITTEEQPPTVGDSLGVVIDSSVPVHRRMSLRLDAPGFEMASPNAVPRQVRDGQAGWSWIITPTEGPLGEREVSALVTANGRTLSALKTSVMVTRPEPGATVTTNAGIYPRPTTIHPPTPVPTATPAVELAATVVPPSSPTPAPAATPTAAPHPVPTASPVPVHPPATVPSITPKTNEQPATVTPTPTAKPSPSPRFRLFINGVQAAALNDMMSVGGNTVILSKAAEVDGAFQFNDKLTVAVSLEPGYRVAWRGVDAVRGPFATVYMNQDRFVAFDIVPPSVTSTPIPMPVPFYQTRSRVRERRPVVPTPTPRPVRMYALTVGSVPEEGGSVSPEGVTRHPAGARVNLTATPADGYVFSHWSDLCLASLDCGVTMDGDKTVAAHFTRVFELTALPSPADGGTVTPSGATAHRASTKVTVMASPAEGRQFSRWTGDCSGSGACVVTMDNSKSVTAEFVRVFDLTTEAIPPGGGAILPQGKTSYKEGTRVVVTTSPADGYQFSKWGGDCLGDGPCVVTVEGHETVTATFLRVSDLTITADPADAGTLTPGGITSYVDGTNVAILAYPAAGYQFSEWSGACTGGGPCVVTINGDTTVTAKFDRGVDLTVKANPPNGGTILPEGRTSHKPGTTVTIVASPADGYQFLEWTGDCTGSRPCVVITDADKSVTANFIRVFTLTTRSNPPAGGTISPDTATSHTEGSKVTVVASPAEGYQFSEWGGDCTGNGACVVTMDADKAVTANFAQVFDLAVSSDPADGGAVLPGGVTSYIDGTKVTVLAYPVAGYRFSKWSGDCSGSDSCSVTINEDKAVTANFIQEVDLTTAVNPSDGGTVLPAGKTSHPPGAVVTVIATPTDGYQFSEWTIDCSGSGPCVITMDSAKSVTANFVGVFDLTVAAVPTDGGSVFPGSTTSYVADDQVTILARSAAGYQFSEWSGDCSGDSACVVTMDSDKSVTANFKPVFDLTVSADPAAGGTVFPEGTTSYISGAQITILAHPASDYQFSTWSGDCSGNGSCAVVMNGGKSVTASFNQVFDLTVTVDPPKGGFVFPAGTTSYAEGGQITLTARPAYGYAFSGWGGDCSGIDSCIVTMDDNKTVTANFVKQFVLTTVANPSTGGDVSPSGTTQHAEGTEVTVTASPAEGYGFSGWSGDCSGAGPCVVTMDSDKSVTANFVTRFTLTTVAEPSSGGTLSPKGTTSYDAGTQVTVTATPASGYNFSGWSGDCSGSGSCVVTMDGDKSVTAKFTSTAAIAFHSSRDGNSEIYIMDADGSNITRLTNNSTADSDPNWSHDGNKIAFVAARDGNSEIYVMNVDGSNPVNLTNNDAEDISPAWSPDGTKIAFVSTRGSKQDIYIMDADGSNQTKLTDDSHLDDSPDWSPDGTKIVFASNKDGDFEVYKMSSDGSNVAQLTYNPAKDFSPVWSPDGETIAFVSLRDQDAEVYTMLTDGTNDYNITFAGTEDESPAWSPDSAKIILVSDQTDIILYDAEDPDGVEAITIATGGSGDGGLDWKPNLTSED